MTCLPLPLSRLIGALLFLSLGAPSWSQPHQQTIDQYVLRSSVTSTQNISAESAKEHGIVRAPDVAILNVTVTTKGSQLTETVPAKVTAVATNLVGQRQKIDLTATKADGWVSYSGTFKFASREVLTFAIQAEPVPAGKPLKMTFREIMPIIGP